MKKPFFRHRPGTTLIELLVFLAIMALVIGVTVPLLFTAAENRVLQQTISIVEHNGAQIIQNIGVKIRNSESIALPATGQEGKVLVLQTGSGTTNPTIVALQSGSIILVQRAIKETVTSEQVAVENFRVSNTSVSDTSQSVAISFTVSRTIRLQRPYSYRQQFEAAFSLLPDEERTGNCNCPPPTCLNGTALEWYVCDTGVCDYGATALQC